MADIAAANVATTLGKRYYDPMRGGYENEVTLVFGDGALVYGAAKVPLTKGAMGCPNVLEDFIITDAGVANGFLYKFDKANALLRIYQGDNDNAADAPLVELGAVAPAAATLKGRAIGY